MTLQLAINPTALLTIATFGVLLAVAMPTPIGFVSAVRALLFRPLLAVIAGIGLYIVITLAGALMSLPPAQAAAPAKPAPQSNHRGEPIGDLGGHL